MYVLRLQILMLALWAFPLVATPYSNPDSLRQALSTAQQNSEKLTILTELAAYYCMQSNDSTQAFCQEMLELAQQLKDPNSEVRALLTLGLWHHNKGRFGKAKVPYFQALSIAEAHQLGGQLPLIYNNLGVAYQREYQQDSAYFFFLKAEHAFIEQGSPYELWKAYNGLFEFFSAKGDTAQARIFAHKAFEIVEQKGNRIDRGYLLFQLLYYFFQTGQFDQMAFFQDKWEQYQLEKKTSLELMEKPEHIALFMFGRGESSLVGSQLQRAIQYFDASDNKYRAGWCYEDLANYYQSNRQEALAEEAFRSALLRYQQCGAGYRRGRVLFQLYQIYKGTGRPALALDYLESYKQLADSLSGIVVEENLNELRVQYDTEQKEQALRIQSLELDQKTQQRNILLASSLVLALLAAGIFLGLRHRLRTNRILAGQESQLQEQRIQQLEQENRLATMSAMIEGQEKERLRIATDLHDSLGGLLTSAKAHFGVLSGQGITASNQPALTQQTARLLDDAGVELRRISQNLMPRSLAILGLQGAVADLAGQLRQSEIECQLEMIGMDTLLPQTTEVMAFRIIQELTNNILKHAGARKVLIQLIQQDGELHLILEDDGEGFDLETALQKESLGLSSIKSRVKFLKGELDFDTAPGQGTTVTVRVPVNVN